MYFTGEWGRALQVVVLPWWGGMMCISLRKHNDFCCPQGLLLKYPSVLHSQLQKIDEVASFSSTNMWTGAHDAGNDNQFVWIGTNDAVPTELWGFRQPDYGTIGQPKDCVFISFNVLLYSTECSARKFFACEANLN